MKTHRFRLAAALTAAMIVLTALTGCMTGPRKPSSPAESAVTVDGEIRGLFIHATGQDLIIQSPYDAGTVAQSLDQIMSYAGRKNGINTVFMDVHDAKGSALYTSDYMPTSELMLDEKGKNSGGDIVYEAVRLPRSRIFRSMPSSIPPTSPKAWALPRRITRQSMTAPSPMRTGMAPCAGIPPRRTPCPP